MQKVIKVNNLTIAVLSCGDSYQREDLSEEDFEKLCKATTDEEVIAIMDPNCGSIVKEVVENKKVIEEANKSDILTFKDDAVYWEEISGLSMPKELAQAVLDAEKAKDDIRIETYRNFWTLMCLNPNEECRHNLYWFLTKWGMKISRSGFFVAYRNVDIHKKGTTLEDTVFTDHYTHTFRIKIGEMVTQDRDRCDCDSNISCSKGLHCGGQDWLNHNYFGTQGLVCLVNPAEVVAVP